MEATLDRRKEFEDLLAPVAAVAYRVAHGLTHNAEDAMDLVQDATVQAFRAFGTFASGSNFKAWFLRILTNRYLKSRSKKALPVQSFDEVEDVYLFQMTRQAGLHGNPEDPVRLVLDGLELESVQQAMQTLPDEYRSAAVLYFLEDSSYEEIAHVLDVPVGTVRSRLHRGRKLLQKALWEVAVERGIVSVEGQRAP
ncbi:MAG: sigma-70 family RNA polymerase sigma factor [Armatimonadetes bacterium]|nr:sigma-70 family RNA polymerase sigma factor [Armatimonadota bacterium]